MSPHSLRGSDMVEAVRPRPFGLNTPVPTFAEASEIGPRLIRRMDAETQALSQMGDTRCSTDKHC